MPQTAQGGTQKDPCLPQETDAVGDADVVTSVFQDGVQEGIGGDRQDGSRKPKAREGEKGSWSQRSQSGIICHKLPGCLRC